MGSYIMDMIVTSSIAGNIDLIAEFVQDRAGIEEIENVLAYEFSSAQRVLGLCIYLEIRVP